MTVVKPIGLALPRRDPRVQRLTTTPWTPSQWTSVCIICLYVLSLTSTVLFQPAYSIKTRGLGNRKVQMGPGLTQISMQQLQIILATSSANTNKTSMADIPASAVLYNIAKPYLAPIPGPTATDFPACVMRNLPDTYGLCAASWTDLEDGKYTHVLNYQFVASRTALKNRDRSSSSSIRTLTTTTWALRPIPPGRDRAMYVNHALSPIKDHWIPVYPTPANAADCRQREIMPAEVQDYCNNDLPNLLKSLGLTADTGLYLRAYYLDGYPMYLAVAGVETNGFNEATVKEIMVRDPFTFEVDIDLKACEAGGWSTCFLVTTRQSIKSVSADDGAMRITIWFQVLGMILLPFVCLRTIGVDVGFSSFFVTLRFGMFNIIVAQLGYYLYFDVRMLGYYRPMWSLFYYGTIGHVNGWLLLVQLVAELFTIMCHLVITLHEYTTVPGGNALAIVLAIVACVLCLIVEVCIWSYVDSKGQYQTCTNTSVCSKHGVTCCGDISAWYFVGTLTAAAVIALVLRSIAAYAQTKRRRARLRADIRQESMKLSTCERKCLHRLELQYRTDATNYIVINGTRAATIRGIVNIGFVPTGNGLIRCDAMMYVLMSMVVPHQILRSVRVSITCWEVTPSLAHVGDMQYAVYTIKSVRRCQVADLKLRPRINWQHICLV